MFSFVYSLIQHFCYQLFFTKPTATKRILLICIKCSYMFSLPTDLGHFYLCCSYRYGSDKTEEIHSSEHHDSALRSILYNRDGSCLYTASKDKSVAVLDSATWAVKKHYVNAHDTSVYSLCAINDHTFASGDDDGTLKIWDVRRDKAVFSIKRGEETINAMIVDDAGKTLVAALNDGSIYALNLSKRKLIVEVSKGENLSLPLGPSFTDFWLPGSY